MRTYFTLHFDSLEIEKKLSDEQLGKLFRAMIKFHKEEKYELDFALDLAFQSFKNQFTRDIDSYVKFTEKQSENGKKGGRPKKAKQSQKTQAFFGKPTESQKSLKNKEEYKEEYKEKKENNKIQIPVREEFLNFGKEICEKLGKDFEHYEFSLETKYDSWVAAKWKDGNNKAIKNWKLKLRSTFPYLKATYQEKEKEVVQTYPSIFD